MLPLWLSSWYQHQQVQEPFNDQYEAADEDGDWVEVITPSTKRRQPQQQQQKDPEKDVIETIATSTMANTNTANEHIATVAAEPVVKGLSRQERRAKVRFTIKEKKKQARNATMVLNRNRKGLASSCLPSGSLSIEH